MTPDEVRLRLGLQPWADFAQVMQTRFVEINTLRGAFPEEIARHMGRQTGRTMFMVVHALSELTEGRDVRLVGLNRDISHVLQQRVEASWVRLFGQNLDRRRVRYFTIQATPQIILNGFSGWLGIDHTVDEVHPDLASRLRELWKTTQRPPHVEVPFLRRPSWELLFEDGPWD